MATDYAALGKAVLEIVTDQTGLDKGIKDSKAKAEQLGKDLQKTGKNLSLWLTGPLVAGFALATKAAGEQAAATAQLENAIRAAGNEASISVQALSDLAGALQQTTLYSDDESAAAMTLLEQLTALDQEGLSALLPRIQNMATALGIDLNAAAQQAGSAISGASNEIRKVNTDLKDTMTPAERAAEVMRALDASFAGAAETAATAGTGPLLQLKNLAGDMAETFGFALLPAITSIVGVLKYVITWIGGLDQGTVTFIVTAGLLIAAIGPVVGIVGGIITAVTTLIGVFQGVGGAMSLLAGGPITLIIAAVALIAFGVYELIKNWDSVVAFFKDLWEKVAGFFSGAWEAIKKIVASLYQWIKDHFELILLVIAPFIGLPLVIAKNWDAIVAFFQDLVTKVIGLAKALYEGVRQWLVGKFEDVVSGIKDAIDKVVGFFTGLYDKVVGHSIVPDLVDGVIGEFERMSSSLEKILARMGNIIINNFGDAFEELGRVIVESGDAWGAFKDAAKKSIAAVLEMLGRELAIWAIANIVINPAAAIAAGIGSVAAFTVAGVVKAMAGGGLITEPVVGRGMRSGQTYLLGEAGPERVSPVGGGGSGDREMIHTTVMINEKVLFEGITEGTRDRRLLLHARAIIT